MANSGTVNLFHIFIARLDSVWHAIITPHYSENIDFCLRWRTPNILLTVRPVIRMKKQKDTVKNSRIMNVDWLLLCIIFTTSYRWKIGIYIWILDIFTFPQGLAPSWQRDSCWFLCLPSLTTLYNGLIDLETNSKVMQGVWGEKPTESMYILVFFANFQINHIQNSSVRIDKIKDCMLGF